MSENIDTSISLLTQFGVNQEEAEIYLAILQRKGSTALSISRAVKIPRTKVYRLMDNLIDKGLVVTGLGERGTRYSAVSPDQLELLLSDREHELIKLRGMLPKLQSLLTSLVAKAGDTTKVFYYHGRDGLRQITHNSLKAKGELLTYELSTMNAFLSKKEAEEFRRKFVERQIKIRTLTNSEKITAWTDVSEMVENYWEIRHLAPKGDPFQFEILIYNDVYCIYRYVGEEIFCVEIHSQELADMQRQLFEYLWSRAQPFKILNSHGEAILSSPTR